MMILGIKCPDFSLQFFSNYFRSRIPWMTKDASFGSCFENQFPNWIFFLTSFWLHKQILENSWVKNLK